MAPEQQYKEISSRPGISTMVISGRFAPGAALACIAPVGFEALELCLLGGRQHFDYEDPNTVKELDICARDQGMVIWSVHEQDIPQCLGADSRAEQDAAADEVRRCLEVAHRLGATAIASHLMMNAAFDADPIEEAQVERRIVERLHELAPEVRASGARIAFENTGRRTWASPVALARRMATLPTDAYGFVLDTGHANLMGDLDVLMDTFGSRLITVHLDDNHAVKGADEHLPPRMGTVDWAKVRRHLATVAYQGCFMYEVVGGLDPDQVMGDTMSAHLEIFGAEPA
ncbi:MAG: sugar phosphate isomerase/epimerase family protein [Planctomycetota bacterium]|nr:sugar phosphate isomerase/epimerase family protein [Planctomycetota bacterium]